MTKVLRPMKGNKVKANQQEWDLYYLGIAKRVGENSKCLSRKIGAILVKDNSIIASGYNGPPRGYIHCGDKSREPKKKCPRKLLGYKSGEGLEICPAVHAERNAILSAAKIGTPTNGSTLYCYCGFPCKDCLIELINAGVFRIVCISEKNRPFMYDKLSQEIYEYYSNRNMLSSAVYEEEWVK